MQLKKPKWKGTFSETRDGVRTLTMSALVPLPDRPDEYVRLWQEEVWKMPATAGEERIQLEDKSRYWFRDRAHGYATLEVCWSDALLAADEGSIPHYTYDNEGRLQEITVKETAPS